MKVLVVGSGGREHALCWKIAASPEVDEVICAPGNAGIARHARCVDVAAGDLAGLRALARREEVGLAVIGPEVPLVEGLADRLREDGVPTFGPSSDAARLEGSKAYAKQFMARHGIPTARFAVFDDLPALQAHLEVTDGPLVVKADGLAAGKGVVICRDRREALAAADAMMTARAFGDAGARVVVERCLVGEEASYLALVSGDAIVPLVSSQDHKAAYDGDEGPNTGGMGAYCPAPVVTPALEQAILEQVIRPTVAGLAAEGTAFAGLLYAGLMVTEDGPQVLEFNVRFGDPETQPLMTQLDEDLVPVMRAVADGTLTSRTLRWKPGASCCVVMAAGGYPGSYDRGAPIDGLDAAGAVDGAVVFHAGTAYDDDGRLVTAGGRVLGVTAHGADIAVARARAYEAVGAIRWEGARCRTDIAHRAIRRAHSAGEGG